MLGPQLLALPSEPGDARLDRLIEGWWSATTSGGGTVVPDGAIDVLVVPGRVFVAGPDVVPRPAGLGVGLPLVAVRLRPGVAPEVLGDGADRARGRRVDLGEVWSRVELDRLDDELGRVGAGGASGGVTVETATTTATATAIAVARAIDRRLTPHWAPDPIIVEAVAAIARGSKPDPGPLGARQFRRRFSAAIGYGPALSRRIARLGRFTDLLEAEAGRPLAELGHAAGYYDQAHLNRDCRDLLGTTPGALRRVAG